MATHDEFIKETQENACFFKYCGIPRLGDDVHINWEQHMDVSVEFKYTVIRNGTTYKVYIDVGTRRATLLDIWADKELVYEGMHEDFQKGWEPAKEWQ